MSRFHSYLLSAQNIIEGYKAGTPFAYHLKSFFHVEKKYGSRDRKIISAICYSYFRGAYLFNQGSKIEDVIIKTSFLTGADNDELIKNVAPDLYDWIDLELQENGIA